MGDVNADGRSDAVVFFNGDPSGDGFGGDWYVATSTGTSFNNYSLWKTGFGAGASAVKLGDVTGDGRSDAVNVYGSVGQWAVAPSSGSAFGLGVSWATGFATNSSEYFLGDTDRDGKLDAVAYNNASWVRALSNGSGFGSSLQYAAGHGSGSSQRFLVDGNGDGFAEPYAYFTGDVGTYNPADGAPGDLVAREFDRASRNLSWEDTVINTGFGSSATRIFMASVDGDSYGWKNLISFTASSGTWQVQRYRQGDQVSINTWGGFPNQPAIGYLPLTLGTYQTYDSGNPAVIDEHIQTISAAKIDYLLLDETNNLNVVSGAVLNRAARVSARISAWNDNVQNARLRYAFAIGGIQWSNNPVTIENEARQTWDEFANNPSYGGDDYYKLGSKPLLVVYTTKSNQAAWLAYSGDKSASNRFTVKFASSDPSVTSGEYGWQLPSTGAVDNADVMVAMPGWNNHRGNPPVVRDKGAYYTAVWNKILARNPLPSSVVINSFNEHAEDTGMQVSDTSQLPTTSERWYNANNVLQPDFYWNLTVGFVAQYKSQ